MYLYELFEHLSSGEFGGEAIGNAEGGGIQEKDYALVIPFINAGLISLYREFNLREDEVLIQQYEEISEYFLHDKYAASNTASAEPTKYILDTAEEPFVTDRVLRINSVVNEVGEEIVLNDRTNSDSYWTPSFRSIQVPLPNNDNQMAVLYRAKPDKIPNDADPTTYEVELPFTYLNALLSYVASRYYLSRPGFENRNASAEFTQRYRLELNDLKVQTADQQEIASGTRLVQDGWA